MMGLLFYMTKTERAFVFGGNGEPMLFPDFDTYNQKASVYAKSGVSQSQLIQEAVQTRDLLVTELKAMPAEQRQRHLMVNRVSHCPHTDQPYSLAYIIEEFTQHDHHHKLQIESFWQATSLEIKKERKA